MMKIVSCRHCGLILEEKDRVIYSQRQTFVFKPIDVPDAPGVNPAEMTPDELRESRKDHLRTTIGNIFVDWGKEPIPDDAFNFRHQWCEPIRTASAGNLHNVNKHAIRFARRAAPRRGNG